ARNLSSRRERGNAHGGDAWHPRANRAALAASYGRDDAQLVARLQARVQALVEPHVLAVDVQVHEAAQRATLVAQSAANGRIAALELDDDAGHRRGLQTQLRRTVGRRAQRRRNAHTNAHGVGCSAPTGSTRTPCSLAHDSDFSTASGVPTTSRITQPRS